MMRYLVREINSNKYSRRKTLVKTFINSKTINRGLRYRISLRSNRIIIKEATIKVSADLSFKLCYPTMALSLSSYKIREWISNNNQINNHSNNKCSKWSLCSRCNISFRTKLLRHKETNILMKMDKHLRICPLVINM